MASGSRPRRLTAQQALDLFTQELDHADSESSQSDDLFGNLTDPSSSESSGDESEERPLLLAPSTSTGPPQSKKSRFSLFKGKGRGKATKRPAVIEENENRNDEWRQVPLGTANKTTNAFRFAPPLAPGVNAAVDESSSALDCFFTLFTSDIVDSLIQAINDYAALKVQMNNPPRRRSTYTKWTPIDREEIFRFMTLMIVVGMDKRPRIRDFFAKTPAHWYTPWFHQMFPSRDRFLMLYHTMLHTGDADAKGKNKIEPFLYSLVENFQQAFYPFQSLSIDEMIIGFKGRFQSKRFNQSKPHKYHIKSFGLCDSLTGYVWNLLLYFGKDTSNSQEADPEGQQAVKVFQTLLANTAKGHTVYANRYYTSRPVINYLLSEQKYFTGTLQVNRRDFPGDLKNIKMKYQETKWYLNEGDSILCVAWRDKKAKKPCIIVSTDSAPEMTTVMAQRGDGTQKPSMVVAYNHAMNGCDKADQNIGYYGPFNRRSKKWWRKIFFWLLEISQFNAHILYTMANPDQPRKEFRRFKDMLIEQMQERVVAIQAIGAQPVLVERHRSKMHLIQHSGKDRNCVFCSTPQKRQRTSFVCTGCTDQPHLHPNGCFYAYHTTRV